MVIPADIAIEAIRSRLTSRIIGQRVEVVAEIGSTNDAAIAAGRGGEPEGFAILADRQTGGRGRLGRSWTSLSGLGIYTSILLRPATPPVGAPILTLMAGLAAVEAIQAVGKTTAVLKWPNDVLCDGRKVGGVLTEMATMGNAIGYVVVGVGINVGHRSTDFPVEIAATATSIELSVGHPVDRGAVIAALYNAMDRWYGVFRSGRTDAVVQAARRRTVTLGRPVTVMTDGGGWKGVALDLDTDGALLVQDETGTVHRVLADDVSIR